MEFLTPAAELLGMTVGQLTTIVVVLAVLVVGWYVLRTAVRLAARTFAIGCFVIVLIGAALSIIFVVM